MKEFQKFITRGNVLDMAVGVIVGSAFTAIVNAMSNNILKPLINWLLTLVLGKNSLSEVFTFLQKTYAEDGTVDLAQSIYIDWGAFINAIINFLIIAFVLFCIVKAVNELRENAEEVKALKLSKEDRKILKSRGVNRFNKTAIKVYLAEKRSIAEAEAKKKAEEEAAKAAKEREENPTSEDLLKKILAELSKK